MRKNIRRIGMTKLSYQVTFSVLGAVLALCIGLCLLFIPKTGAKASTNALSDVPFTVSDGNLKTTGGEGIISTVQVFENNGFTLDVRLTVTESAAELYLGENLEYYVRVTPLGTAPGVSITKRDKRLTVFYNTFTGCNYALGDVIDLRLSYAGGKLAFAMKKESDSDYTSLSAKITQNSEQKNLIFSNNAPGLNPMYTYDLNYRLVCKPCKNPGRNRLRNGTVLCRTFYFHDRQRIYRLYRRL